MTVKEYREQKPNCRYCGYSIDIALGVYYCRAKERYIACNKAKKCKVYKARSVV